MAGMRLMTQYLIYELRELVEQQVSKPAYIHETFHRAHLPLVVISDEDCTSQSTQGPPCPAVFQATSVARAEMDFSLLPVAFFSQQL